MHQYSLLTDTLGNPDIVDDLFLFNIYYYYHHRGYLNILFNDIVNLLILTFSVIFVNFLMLCIRFDKLISYTGNDKISFSNYVTAENLHKGGVKGYIVIFSILYGIYFIFQVINIISSSKKFAQIKKLYQRIELEDQELGNVKWNVVVEKISTHFPNPNLNPYTIANRILKKENLMISLLNNPDNKLDQYYMTKLLEWNYIYCFIAPLFNEKNEIDPKYLDEGNTYLKKAKNRLKWISIFNLILMPFILIYLVFYLILQYGEQFYKEPHLISSRQWALDAKWRLRCYNELPHLFYDRLKSASKYGHKYLDEFPNKTAETISRFVVFVLGSFFLVLLIVSVLNENLLINLDIFSNKPVLWCMGIFGGISAVLKNLIVDKMVFRPKKQYNEIIKYITLPEEWEANCDQKEYRNHFIQMFPYHILTMLYECVMLLFTPYILYFKVRKVSPQICQNILAGIDKHHVLGHVAKNSLFNNLTQVSQNKKTQESFDRFKDKYPEHTFSRFLYSDDSLIGESLLESVVAQN